MLVTGRAELSYKEPRDGVSVRNYCRLMLFDLVGQTALISFENCTREKFFVNRSHLCDEDVRIALEKSGTKRRGFFLLWRTTKVLQKKIFFFADW